MHLQYCLIVSLWAALGSGAPAAAPAPTTQTQSSTVPTVAPTGNQAGPNPPLVASVNTGSTTHGPYLGTPAADTLSTTVLASSIPALPPNPTATYYNAQGVLLHPEPAPYAPNGGLGTNGSLPRYMVESDFDFESIALALYQEYIELDLFMYGLAAFTADDFLAAGLTAEDRSLIAFMAQQEAGHATLLTNMLGEAAPVQCTYDYPFTTVREFIDFNQKLTRWGECGVLGFINHLDSREVAQMLGQSIAVEMRQEMSFRQMLGLHPYPYWFSIGLPQSWSWTYLAQYISSCPANITRLAWQNFPALHILNQPNPNLVSQDDAAKYGVVGNRTGDPSDSNVPSSESCVNLNTTGSSCGPAIGRDRSDPMSFPGRKVLFSWDNAGQRVGPNNSYVTSTQAGTPAYVAWVAQLNTTFTALTVTGNNQGWAYQPASEVYEGDPAANGTVFVALTDTNLPVTPFNLTMLNPHIVALGIYQAG